VEQLYVSAKGIDYDDYMRETHVGWEWTDAVRVMGDTVDRTNQTAFKTACNGVVHR
jgi:hypothetical protein